jgi:glucose-1-phosphatase
VDLYLFDLDKTLYAYDFRRRLPELARRTGVSQYGLASRWWAAGYERRAEAGEPGTADAYLDLFAEVTGGRRLDLQEWGEVRAQAMTRMPAAIDAMRLAASIGTVALLSNNPAATADALPLIAPDVAELVGERALFSSRLGVRKPDPEIYRRALERLGAERAMLVDDSRENVLGAREAGLEAWQVVWTDGVPQLDGLPVAIEGFAR